MDREAIYLDMFKEWRTHVRHHETQRSTIMSVCAALAGAIVAYVGSTYKSEGLGVIAPAIFLVGLGATALFTSQKHYERTKRALKIADAYQDAIDNIRKTPEDPSFTPAEHATGTAVSLRQVVAGAEETHKAEFPTLHKVRLHLLWNSLFVAVSLIGMFFILLSLHRHHLAAHPNSPLTAISWLRNLLSSPDLHPSSLPVTFLRHSKPLHL